MNNNDNTEGKNAKWGTYLFTALLVAAVCVAVLWYIGWFDNKTHVDSRGGDDVEQTYVKQTPQPDAPGERDWENPDHQNVMDIIVDHAEGSDAGPIPQ